MINHAPWFDDTLKSGVRLSTLTKQKTIKTECNKRVSMREADPDKPVTCPDCIQVKKDFLNACKALGIIIG